MRNSSYRPHFNTQVGDSHSDISAYTQAAGLTTRAPDADSAIDVESELPHIDVPIGVNEPLADTARNRVGERV